MGARQSKRSVDITTEPSKDILEGTGELKKLDDTFVKENDSLVSVCRDKRVEPSRAIARTINDEPL